jgi:hypothetical protein
VNRFTPIRLKHYHGEGKADQRGEDSHKPWVFIHAVSRYVNPHLKFLRGEVAGAARRKRCQLNPRWVHVEFVVNEVAMGEGTSSITLPEIIPPKLYAHLSSCFLCGITQPATTLLVLSLELRLLHITSLNSRVKKLLKWNSYANSEIKGCYSV